MAFQHHFGETQHVVENNIQKLREGRGWKRPELAKRADTSPQQIERLEKAQRRLSDHWMERLAKAFEIPPHELITPAGYMTPVRMVPVLGAISCGDFKQAIAETSDFVPVPGETGPNSYALRASGDSMDLLIEDGGYVIIDPDQNSLMDGKVYAVINGDDEATLKKFRVDPARFEPCSSNPNHHAIIVGTDNFHVLGRVTWKNARV